MPVRRAGRAALVLVPLLVVAGCQDGVTKRVRSATYPPNFNYITPQQLKSTMWQLADLVKRLDHTLASKPETDASRRQQAIEILGSMADTARALGPGDWPSNHPRVSRNIEAFRDAVRAAQRDLQLDPPSYFRAGTIAGACLSCHRALGV